MHVPGPALSVDAGDCNSSPHACTILLHTELPSQLPFSVFFKCKMFTKGSDSLNMMPERLSVQGFDWRVILLTATVS